MKKYVLALDQGTTSSRTIVFDKAGRIMEEIEKLEKSKTDGKMSLGQIGLCIFLWNSVLWYKGFYYQYSRGICIKNIFRKGFEKYIRWWKKEKL